MSKLEEKKFKSTTLRTSLLDDVADFIQTHPVFVEKNPEYNSISGFIDQATRKLLQDLKTKVESEV